MLKFATLLILALGGIWAVAILLLGLETHAQMPPAFPIERGFSHPLPYTATVMQSGPGIAEPRVRYYVPKEKR